MKQEENFFSGSRVILLHGTGGHPCIHWLPWLRLALERAGAFVVVPWFPTPEGQHLETWFSIFSQEVGVLEESDVLIGHSVGACFLLRALERSQVKVRAAHLVAGFHTLLPDEEINQVIRSFVFDPFDWDRVRSHARRIEVYHGDTDPYVPISKARELALHLAVKVHLIKDGGHLNSDSGFSEFPYLLDSVTDRSF